VGAAACTHCHRGIAASFAKTLINQLNQNKQYDQVEAEMEKYLESFPEDDRMREMLAIAKQ
jgi:hypothetical protein